MCIGVVFSGTGQFYRILWAYSLNLGIVWWASYQTRKLGAAHAPQCRKRFPCHRLQRKPLVSDPGMHHGTCVTAFPAHAQPTILRIWQEARARNPDEKGDWMTWNHCNLWYNHNKRNDNTAWFILNRTYSVCFQECGFHTDLQCRLRQLLYLQLGLGWSKNEIYQ